MASKTNIAHQWHMSGITRDRRSLRVANSKGELVALVPIQADAPKGFEEAEQTAMLISSAAHLHDIAETILKWDERQERDKRLPRTIERKLISTLAKAQGHI